jgi:hypothetical protein
LRGIEAKRLETRTTCIHFQTMGNSVVLHNLRPQVLALRVVARWAMPLRLLRSWWNIIFLPSCSYSYLLTKYKLYWFCGYPVILNHISSVYIKHSIALSGKVGFSDGWNNPSCHRHLTSWTTFCDSHWTIWEIISWSKTGAKRALNIGILCEPIFINQC